MAQRGLRCPCGHARPTIRMGATTMISSRPDTPGRRDFEGHSSQVQRRAPRAVDVGLLPLSVAGDHQRTRPPLRPMVESAHKILWVSTGNLPRTIDLRPVHATRERLPATEVEPA